MTIKTEDPGNIFAAWVMVSNKGQVALPINIRKKLNINIGDGSKNEEYYTYCYKNGSFTNPTKTMDQMIAGCIGMMVKIGTPELRQKNRCSN